MRTETREAFYRYLKFCVLLSIIMTPITAIFLLILPFKEKLAKKYGRKVYKTINGSIALAGGIMMILGFIILSDLQLIKILWPVDIIIDNIKIFIKTNKLENTNLKDIIFGANTFILGFGILRIGLLLIFLKLPRELRESQFEVATKESNRHIIKNGDIDLENRQHVFAVGTTGSGKSANCLRYVEKAMKDDQFIVIIDGKGSIGDYDLGTVTEKLAKKYGRKVYKINQSDLSDTDPYNPLLKTTPTEMKDMLISMRVNWHSDYFKDLAGSYVQFVGKVFETEKIRKSFRTVLEFCTPIVLHEYLDRNPEILKKDIFFRGEASELFSKDSESAIGGLKSGIYTVINGDGRKLFADKGGWNISTAYKDNAVVIVLLNELRFKEFAPAVGRLVLCDFEKFIGKKRDDRACLCVMDELGVYANENMDGNFNRSRSGNIKVIASVQSLVDIDKTNDKLTSQILSNCHNYLIMKTNDFYTSEQLAKNIGTKKTIEKTSRGKSGYLTGDASNKIVEEYKLHPNQIKELKDLKGFFYDSNKNEISSVRTKFVEV